MGSELVAPEADRFVGDEDAPPGQQIPDVPVAQIEAVIEPDGILDDLRRKSVALVLSSRVFHPGDGRASPLNLAVPDGYPKTSRTESVGEAHRPSDSALLNASLRRSTRHCRPPRIDSATYGVNLMSLS